MSECSVTQLCLTLCELMDSSPPGTSVHGILQATILEGVTISSSMGSSQPKDWTNMSCFDRRIGKPHLQQAHQNFSLVGRNRDAFIFYLLFFRILWIFSLQCFSVKIYLSEAVFRCLWVTSISLLHYYCHLILRWFSLKEIIEVLILHVNLYMGLFGRNPWGRMPAESGSEWPKDDIKAAAPPCVLKLKRVPTRF